MHAYRFVVETRDATSMKAMVAIVAAFALSACANEPLIISDASEIAAHRASGSFVIRGADQCVHEGFRDEEIGYGIVPNITLRIDHRGNPNFVSIDDTEQSIVVDFGEQCRRQIESAIVGWRYRPFEQNGHPHEAQIVERIVMLPQERWRDPPEAFPEIQNLDEVVITLGRQPSFYRCDEGDRPDRYMLQIHGNGNVVLTEIIEERASGYIRNVDGEVRRWTVSKDAVEGLIQQFRAANFFSLKTEYLSGYSHQSFQRLMFDTGATRTSVEDLLGETVGMPLVVRDLQVAVDAVAGLGPLRCGPERAWQAR